MNEKLGKQQCLEAPAHVEKQQLGLLIIYCNNTCKVTNALLRKVMSQAQENNCTYSIVCQTAARLLNVIMAASHIETQE